MPSSSDYSSPKYESGHFQQRGFPMMAQPTDFTPFVSGEPVRGREIDPSLSSSGVRIPRGVTDYYPQYYAPQPMWGFPYAEQEFSRPLVPPAMPATSFDRIAPPMTTLDHSYPRRFDPSTEKDLPIQSPILSSRQELGPISSSRQELGLPVETSLPRRVVAPMFPTSPTWSPPDVGKRPGGDHELSTVYPDELPDPVGAGGDRKGLDDIGRRRDMGDLYDPEIDGLPIPGIDGIDLKSAEPKRMIGKGEVGSRGDVGRTDKKIEIHDGAVRTEAVHDKIHMGINSPTAPLSPIPQLVESDVAPLSPVPQLVSATSRSDMQGSSDSLPSPSIDPGTSKDRTSFALPHPTVSTHPSGSGPSVSSLPPTFSDGRGSTHLSASLPPTFPSSENHRVEASGSSISSSPPTFPDGRGSELPVSSISPRLPQPFPTLIGPPGEAHRIPSHKPVSHRPMSPGIPFPSGPHMLPIGSPRALTHPYMPPFSPRFGVRPVGPTIKSIMSDPGIEIRSINPINFDRPIEVSVFDGKQERKMWLMDDEQLKERQSTEEGDEDDAEALREEREEKQRADMVKIAEDTANEIVNEKLKMIIERMIHFTPGGGKGPWKKLLRGMTEEVQSDDEDDDEQQDEREEQRAAKRAEEEKENDMVFEKKAMELKAQEVVLSTMINRMSKKEEELNAEVKRREADLDSRGKEVFYREGEASLREGELDRREKKIQEDRVARLEHEMTLQAKVSRLEEEIKVLKSASEDREKKKAEDKKEDLKKAEEILKKTEGMSKNIISGMSDTLRDAIRSNIPSFPGRPEPSSQGIEPTPVRLNGIWGQSVGSHFPPGPYVQPGPYTYVPSSQPPWFDEDDMGFPTTDLDGCSEGPEMPSGVTIEVVDSSQTSFRLPDEGSLGGKDSQKESEKGRSEKESEKEQNEKDEEEDDDEENLISGQLVDMESLTSLVE